MSTIIEEKDTGFQSALRYLHQTVAVVIVKIVQKTDTHDKLKYNYNYLNRIILCRSFWTLRRDIWRSKTMVMLVACAKFLHVHTAVKGEDHSHQSFNAWRILRKNLNFQRKHPCCTFSVHTTKRQIGCQFYRPICRHTDQNLMRA